MITKLVIAVGSAATLALSTVGIGVAVAPAPTVVADGGGSALPPRCC